MKSRKKLKILHVVPSYLPALRYGGPIQSVHGTCRSLAKEGHDVHVFTTNINGPDNLDVPLGVPVDLDGVKVWYFPVLYRRLCWAPSMSFALKDMLVTFDIVHLHSIFLWPTWAAARQCRKTGIPYVVSPRGMFVLDMVKAKSRFVKSAWISLIERKNLEMANAIHATSPREEIEAGRFGFKLPEVAVIPNGINLDDAILSKKDKPNKRETNQEYILFVGRISWEKGLDRLIKSLAFAPNVNLIIAGNDETGYQASLLAIAKEEGVMDRIRFIGPTYGSEKFDLMRNALFLVLPSYSENFGNVVLEAMAVGCPVVVSKEVGAAEIVSMHGAGIVADGEPNKLGPMIAGLTTEPDKLHRLGILGQEAVSKYYLWENVAVAMEQLYSRCIYK